MDRIILMGYVHKLIRCFPYLSIIAVLATTGLLILSSNYILLIKASIILIPVVFISIFIIYNQKVINNININSYCPPRLLNISPKRLTKLYFIFFFSTLCWTVGTQNFDLVFIVLIIILYGTTITHIFSDDTQSSRLILCELVLTSILFCSANVFSNPYSFPSVDVLPHTQLAEVMINTGSILPGEISGAYKYFPLYHILLSGGTLLLGLPAHISAYIITIPMIILISICVYYIARYFCKSEFIAKLSSLFFLLIPCILYQTVCIMAMTPATMAFFIILYLIYHEESKISSIIRWILTAVVVIFMTLVHHMTMPLAFLVITMLIISTWLYSKKLSKGQKGIFLLFYSIPALYWIYTYISTIVNIIDFRLFSSFETGMAIETIEITHTFSPEFWINSSMSVLMIILLYFAVSNLSGSRTLINRICIIFPIVIMFLIAFIPNILDISSLITDMLQIIRWRVILAPIFAIILAIGCGVIFNVLNQIIKYKNLVPVIMVIFCICCVIASPVLLNAKDSTVFENTEHSSLLHFEDSDLALFDTQNETVRYGSNIYSDYTVNLYYPLSSTYEYTGQPYYSRTIGMEKLFKEPITIPAPVYIIFRHTIYDKDILSVRYREGDGGAHILKSSEDGIHTFMKNTNQYNKYYENGHNTIYYNG